MKTLIRNTALTASLLIASIAQADQADLDQELANYKKIIHGTNFESAKLSMETLRWSGISDTSVYDPLAEQLPNIQNDKSQKEKAAWYAKALGFSGNEKYRSILEDALNGESVKSVKRYAKIGLSHLDNHKTWNAIIAKGTVSAPKGKLAETRVANMLRADDYKLLRLGAKRIANNKQSDEALIAIAAERLGKEWQNVSVSNKAQVDSVAWLLRAVGTSRENTHKPLLEEIQSNADLPKIKKYAKKALKAMKS